jgi:exosome complex RNA-binding protein Rrp4
VDEILDQYELRHKNPSVSSSKRESVKRFQLNSTVKSEIKKALMVGQNGKIYFKNKRHNHTLKHSGTTGLKATEEQPSEYEDD